MLMRSQSVSKGDLREEEAERCEVRGRRKGAVRTGASRDKGREAEAVWKNITYFTVSTKKKQVREIKPCSLPLVILKMSCEGGCQLFSRTIV